VVNRKSRFRLSLCRYRNPFQARDRSPKSNCPSNSGQRRDSPFQCPPRYTLQTPAAAAAVAVDEGAVAVDASRPLLKLLPLPL